MPISLCNVAYKCLTKVLANRLKPLMENLISPFQASFIPGRCIQDNIVIGKEIVHSINKCRGRRGFCIIKVDLEKAAHKWSFVEDTLKEGV